MKAIMVMFDSLNRHLLPPYGCDWTHAPNFKRLAEKSATFDRSYVCSMPCMPARRDLHTGRPNFLHRSWGPLEPFDNSVPEILKKAGIYSHLATDHQHYFEDGGGNYHTRYNSWEFLRGQEGDPFIGQVKDPETPEFLGQGWRQDWVNRPHLKREELQPQAKTFAAGMEFIARNAGEDNWFLQIETFDPHEPFFSQQHYKDLYPHAYAGPHFDWPPYDRVTESHDQVEHVKWEYAALLSMCDAYLGVILDAMDARDLWRDTMLVVCTDHGFLLGEHEFWAKMRMPMFEEIAHTPFFVYDPRSKIQNERRNALVQPMLDIGPTLLEFFGLETPREMLGHNLRDAIANDAPVREAAMFGVFGGPLNVTDGRYVLMLPTQNPAVPQFQYTLMPAHMRNMFRAEELQHLEIGDAFGFSKGCQMMKIASNKAPLESKTDGKTGFFFAETGRKALYDLETDPQQQTPLEEGEVEQRLRGEAERLMRQCEAPAEQFLRLGLSN